jgi:hypothetical protein
MTTLAPATTKILPEVVGKALYVELSPILDEEGRSPIWQGKDAVKQIIITPNGNDDLGNSVTTTIMSRIVSPSYPRAQWDSNYVVALPDNATLKLMAEEENSNYFYYKGFDKDEFESYPEDVKRTLFANGIAQMLRGELLRQSRTWNEELKDYETKTDSVWKVSKKFSVEVTDEDLGKVRSFKTPQAIIRRINKVKDLA